MLSVRFQTRQMYFKLDQLRRRPSRRGERDGSGHQAEKTVLAKDEGLNQHQDHAHDSQGNHVDAKGAARRLKMILNFFVDQHIFLSLARGDAEPIRQAYEALPEIDLPVGKLISNHDELDHGRLLSGDTPCHGGG